MFISSGDDVIVALRLMPWPIINVKAIDAAHAYSHRASATWPANAMSACRRHELSHDEALSLKWALSPRRRIYHGASDAPSIASE